LNVGENTCNLVWVQKFSKNIQKQPKSKRYYAVGLVLFSDQDELFGEFLFQRGFLQMFKHFNYRSCYI